MLSETHRAASKRSCARSRHANAAMPAPEDPEDSNGVTGKFLPPVMAVPTSSLLDGAPDDDEISSSHNYGAFVPVMGEFLPLGGGGGAGVWADGRIVTGDGYESEVDSNRPSATTLIYLCALCSSLTSVLLGYGEDGRRREGERAVGREGWKEEGELCCLLSACLYLSGVRCGGCFCAAAAAS